jgi:uncharacterized protein (UPF0333 family)
VAAVAGLEVGLLFPALIPVIPAAIFVFIFVVVVTAAASTDDSLLRSAATMTTPAAAVAAVVSTYQVDCYMMGGVSAMSPRSLPGLIFDRSSATFLL